MEILSGWIVGAYLNGREVALCVIEKNGRAHILRDTFIPAFYAGGEAKDLRALARFILDQPWDVKLSWGEVLNPHLEYPIPVLQVEVLNPDHFSQIYERVVGAKPKLDYYNVDNSIVRQYMSSRDLHPFAFCHLVVDDQNRILAIEVARPGFMTARQSETTCHEKQKRSIHPESSDE